MISTCCSNYGDYLFKIWYLRVSMSKKCLKSCVIKSTVTMREIHNLKSMEIFRRKSNSKPLSIRRCWELTLSVMILLPRLWKMQGSSSSHNASRTLHEYTGKFIHICIITKHYNILELSIHSSIYILQPKYKQRE